MSEFLNIVFSFPTAVYTALVGLTLMFWVLVIAGGMGLEFLDFDIEIDAAAEEAGHSFTELLSVLGVGSVPFSIMLTAFAFWGWTLSYVCSLALRQVFEPSGLIGVGVLVAATAVALPLTGAVTYPFRQLMGDGEETTETIIGSICEISTSRVDDDFGRASVYHEGADLVLSIRCDQEDALERGDQALIIEYDESEDVYWVEPYEDLLERADAGDVDVEDLVDEPDETVLDESDLEEADTKSESVERQKESVEKTTG